MGSGDNIYDRSKAPKEGISSISAKTRKRLYGNQPQPNFSDWYAQQQRGPAQGPVQANQTATKPNDFYTGNAPQLTLDNQQQLLANMFRPESQVPAGGPGSDRQLQMYLDFQREQMANDIRQNPAKQLQAYQAQAQAQDPIRFAQEQQTARLATDPWGPGGQFEGHRAADIYTPEEILASQGNTAQNQILRNRMPISADRRAQLAGVPANQRANAGEFDPEELLRQNAIYRANRTYM
jgi:hypothetical protein